MVYSICCTYRVNAQQEMEEHLKRGLFKESRGVKGQEKKHWWSYWQKWLQDITLCVENSRTDERFSLAKEER